MGRAHRPSTIGFQAKEDLMATDLGMTRHDASTVRDPR